MGEKGDPLAMMADAPEVATKWADAYSAYAQVQQTRAARRQIRADELERPDTGAEGDGPGSGDAAG
jgi:hypothetical protein